MARSYSYYDKQEAMVKIAHALKSRGWKVYGYRADESDSMTDYWSPASCDGIYEKNGFVLCINTNKYTVSSYSGKEVYTYTKDKFVSVDYNKIELLKNITTDRGATIAEEENAKARIEQILNNAEKNKQDIERTKVIDYVYPVFQENPGRATWHIEKDGGLYEKGTNIYRFCDLPYSYNEVTGKIDETRRELDEDSKKLINEFQEFILKLERIVNNMNGMGDGTEETNKKAMEQAKDEKMEKVIVKETKKVLKMVEVTNRNNIQVGDYITFQHRGHYWKVVNEHMQKGTWKGIQEAKNAFTYEKVGAASRGYQQLKNTDRYYDYEFRMIKSLEEGKIKIYELKEVEEVTEVEKWIKVKNEVKKTTKTTEKTKVEINKETEINSNDSKVLDSNSYTFTEDVDTRDNSPLWVLKLKNKVSREEYLKINAYIKSIGGAYSKFKGGFIFKFNPSNSLLENQNNDITTDKIQTKVEDAKDNIKIKNKTKEQDNSKLIGKIESQIESNDNKIKHLSGDYKTNTWKRMREQESRDNQRYILEDDNKLLNYLKNKTIENTITELEKCLIVKTFRDDLKSYCSRHYSDKSRTTYTPIEYPQIRKEWGLDNWYNKEIPTKQKRLNKAGIYNTSDLIKAVEEYKEIKDILANNSTIDLKLEKIKKLEREYKMEQKGDIHFTSSKDLLNKLMDLANIKENEKVLEPSAGIGNIADKMKEYTNNIDVCECIYSYAELLKLKGYEVRANNFMNYKAYNTYDKIVANVPFSVEQEHVRHIYKMIKVGGKAVIITSNSWTFRSDKSSQKFREWLDELTHEVYDIEQGMFEFTNVSCKILVIDKNEEYIEDAI